MDIARINPGVVIGVPATSIARRTPAIGTAFNRVVMRL
jgi:hypothetical protein